jgi:hypothetical protein
VLCPVHLIYLIFFQSLHNLPEFIHSPWNGGSKFIRNVETKYITDYRNTKDNHNYNNIPYQTSKLIDPQLTVISLFILHLPLPPPTHNDINRYSPWAVYEHSAQRSDRQLNFLLHSFLSSSIYGHRKVIGPLTSYGGGTWVLLSAVGWSLHFILFYISSSFVLSSTEEVELFLGERLLWWGFSRTGATAVSMRYV